MASKTPDGAGEILIALGANIPGEAGSPLLALKAALAALEKAGVTVLRVSSFFETKAWPDPTDPPFINAVAAIQTHLQPVALMMLLHGVETAYGRKRSAPNAPRTLDIDLIDYQGRVEEGQVRLPHPRLGERRFVLEPLRQVAPGWRHPISGLGVDALLAGLG
jgi:2-amino-4-hydroxy-6-hydroxymethyldihydropteridine diphosphokinase